MRNILRIGLSVVGVILIINVIEGIDSFVSSLLDYFGKKSFQQYSYTKAPSLLQLVFSTTGIFLKLITGLVLIIKPNVINRFYIPNAYEESENNLPILLVWSFLYCFSVYLIVIGITNLIQIIIWYLQLTSRVKEDIYLEYQYLKVIPEIVKIIIGYYMNKYFKEKLYSGQFKNNHDIM